jgi:hypothetical protein
MVKRLTKCVAKIVVIGAAVWTIPAIDPIHAQMNSADVTRGRDLADRLCGVSRITFSTSGATAQCRYAKLCRNCKKALI